ncbi:MAG TPA: FAD-binding oxidoreductase [Actinophytocola sp.]|uniref:NAD(P)/FAD-dependent oxidoreductase n=1 Tax=Actinophytocola sp. TaxID=1872138 RepID=UPI002E0657DD|nr:FAD-binding oxidoreductase [Actinophytocola sp.]
MTRAAVWEQELSAAERAALHPGLPQELNRRPDVLVVGGGVIGLATAVACRIAGLGSVVVIERAERLASAASGGNGGAIAPDMHALTDSAEFVAFGRASLALYRRLDAQWNGAIGLRTTRWLQMFPAAGGPPALPVGPQFELLDGAGIRVLEPDLALSEGCTALLVGGQGAVNPQRLAAALAGRAGIVASGVEATGVRVRGDRITAVHTSAGDFQPGALVVATGLIPPPWSQPVRQRWVKGHLLATAPGPWQLNSVVSSDQGGVSPLPAGGILSGGTLDHGDTSPEPRPEIVAGLVAGLHRLLPATRHAPLTHRWCCFRPVIDGRHPVIDQLPGTTNGWLSAGHFTTGVLMAAATGQALVSWILSNTRPPETATFDLPTHKPIASSVWAM